MLIAAVNPYHLTTREPAAVAALVLAEHVVTLMPAPTAGRGRAQVAEAVERSPSYLRLMESWRWSMPLWTGGVLGSVTEGERADADVQRACDEIWREEALAPLRALMHEERRREGEEFLEGLSADILRAGPDPAYAVPVAAGLDAFAARHGLVAFRAQVASMAQKAEARLACRLFALCAPLPRDASAERIEAWRASGRKELARAREAMEGAFAAGEPDSAPARSAAGAMAEAGRALAARFGDDDARFVSITGMLLPADAVLRAGAAAASALAGGGARAGQPVRVEGGGAAPLLRAVVVKPLAARPA